MNQSLLTPFGTSEDRVINALNAIKDVDQGMQRHSLPVPDR